MKLQKRFVSLLMVLTLCLSMLGINTPASVAAASTLASNVTSEDIVVLYDNDAHCAVDGYATMAAVKSQMLEKTNNVALVSNGDFLQGAVIGAISKGGNIVNIMNQVDYDVVTLGNHEFDYRVAPMRRLLKKLSADVVSCNFISNYTGKSVYQPYVLKTYGDKEVAFVGITTPESITKSTPTYFQNELGKYAYNFCADETGDALYDCVQSAVDAAVEAGADYVVALSHLGTEGVDERWSAQQVIANTYGIDVVLDGHSHSTIEGTTVTNEKGETVLLSSTGTKFENIGKLVINADGTMNTSLIAVADVKETDQAVADYIANVKKSYEAEVSRVVGTTTSALTTLDTTTNKRAVRTKETNLGDFCADALRTVMEADVAIMNGGGIRANIAAGDVTYNDLLSVFPWGNMACVTEATGQEIKDALEFGARNYPDENGGFLQVSGLQYTINSNIESSVEVDVDGMFTAVAGDYRVSDIKVLNSKTGEYEALDLDKTYAVAGINYTLKSCGDGFTMFADNNYIKDETEIDVDVLQQYITKFLNGTIGDDYANPSGQGRITVK